METKEKKVLDKEDARRLLKENSIDGILRIPSDEFCSIGDHAFSNIPGLRVVIIEEGIEKIGHGAFFICSDLLYVAIGEGVKEICCDAFESCKSLNNISLPDSLTKIGKCAFKDCELLQEIRLPRGVTHIEAKTFYGCKTLKTVTFYADCVENVDEQAFEGCENLTNVNSCNGFMKNIGKRAFAKTCTSSFIMDGLESIGEEALACSGVKGAICLPESVKSLGDNAFLSCKELTEVLVRSKNVRFGFHVFNECEKLVHVRLYPCVLEELLEREINLASSSGIYDKLQYPINFKTIFDAPELRVIGIWKD